MLATIRWLLSIGIGILFGYLSLKEWPAEKMFEGNLHIEGLYLSMDHWKVHIGIFPLYFLTLVSMHVFRVWRWRPLLASLGFRPSFWVLNRSCSVGFMAVFILPFRVGEIVRPLLIAGDTPIRRSSALATIVVERVLDGVMIATFLTIALLFMPTTNYSSLSEITIGTHIALLVFGILVITLALIFIFRKQIKEILSFCLGRFADRTFGRRLIGIIERFTSGLSVFPDLKNLLLFLLLSLGYWFSNGIGLYLMALGFGINVPFLGGFAMMSTIVIGMMIPNAPANVGSFWYFLLKPLEIYGVSPDNCSALVFALSVWLMQLFQLLLFGGYYIASGKVSARKAFGLELVMSQTEVDQKHIPQGSTDIKSD